MGKGIDLARADAPEHAAVMDDLKDQLIIVLCKRLADENGQLNIPVAEMDDTGMDLLSFSITGTTFNFKISKKQ